jgi:septal ring factor EnvC (AmiA/AmiB activator)
MGELTDLLLVICAVLLGFILSVCLYLAFQSTRANRRLRTIMATQAEIAEVLHANDAKLDLVAESIAAQAPILENIKADIQRLKDAVANAGNVSDELQAAVDDLTSDADQLTTLAGDLASGLAETDTAGGDPPVEDPEG